MKVLHVIAGASVGGAETYSQDAIAALADRGVDQRVIGRPHPIALERYAAAGAPFAPFQFSTADRWLGRQRVIRAMAQDFGADVVHAWMSRAASFLPRGLACPAIGWFGGYYDLKYYARCDAFVGVTHDIRDSIVQRGAPAERVFTVHTFGTLPDSPPVNRADLRTPETAIVLLALSRMHPKKGIDLILQAMTALPQHYLWLAGDGPELETYTRLAHTLGVAERVRFLGWRTDRKALLEGCDICVLPSRYEPFGTVIVEAWSMGKPLVSSRAAGARQYVRDGHNGLLFEIDDLDGLVNAIQRLSDDPALADHLTSQAMIDYERTFSRDVATQTLIDVYERVITLGKRR